jgi:hypothetical protein
MKGAAFNSQGLSLKSYLGLILRPGFTQLAEAPNVYLNEATDRIIREEVCKDTELPGER